MAFCKHCGAALPRGANFCAVCGAPAEAVRAAHYEFSVPSPEPPKRLDLSCMLAYIPGLFWLPLASGRRSAAHREAANQGLILTILFVVFSAAAALILGALWQSGYDFGQIEHLFAGFSALNWTARLTQIFGWLGLTALVLYVPINSVCGFFHGMASDKPYRITIFGRLRLIGPGDHV